MILNPFVNFSIPQTWKQFAACLIWKEILYRCFDAATWCLLYRTDFIVSPQGQRYYEAEGCGIWSLVVYTFIFFILLQFAWWIYTCRLSFSKNNFSSVFCFSSMCVHLLWKSLQLPYSCFLSFLIKRIPSRSRLWIFSSNNLESMAMFLFLLDADVPDFSCKVKVM